MLKAFLNLLANCRNISIKDKNIWSQVPLYLSMKQCHRMKVIVVVPLSLQYKLSQSDVAVSSLWLRVWDSNQSGRRLLGEIHQPLSSHNLADPKSHWRPLRDMKVTD